MRWLSLFFAVFAFLASLVTLSLHLDISIFGCPTCSLVKPFPIAQPLAYIGPVALGVLCLSIYLDLKQTGAMCLVASLISASLLVWMITNNKICNACILVHTGVLACAFTRTGKEGAIVGCVGFAFSTLFSGTGGWDRYLEKSLRTTEFLKRSYEKFDSKKPIYVIYSDPECGSCQELEKLLVNIEPGTQVAHRWFILPKSRFRSLPASVLCEQVSKVNAAKGEELRREIFLRGGRMNISELKTLAGNYGFRPIAEKVLLDAPEETLASLADDQTDGMALKLEKIPSLGVVDPGSNKVHWEPIGKLPIRHNP